MTQLFVDFRHVKASAGFAPVLARYGIKMEGKGSQKTILCPFHDEKTPSCKVNLDKKLFHCFGCGAKGNVLDFVTKKEGTDLRSAALLLCTWCGVEPAPGKQEQEGERPKPRTATERENATTAAASDSLGTGTPRNGQMAASEAPRSSLGGTQAERLRPLSFSLQLDPSHPYLRERGLTDEDVKTFGLGYCSRGVMKGRIAIPIHDDAGNLVAYAGRWPGEPPEGEPKYRLPDGFEKSRVLFNLNRVDPDEIEVVVVEGFFGAVALHKLGLPVVACMGSSMSEEQLTLLASRGVRYLTLLFDADTAGDDASKKLAGEAASRFFVRRVTLPKGHQPDTAAAEVVADTDGEDQAWLEELFAPLP